MKKLLLLLGAVIGIKAFAATGWTTTIANNSNLPVIIDNANLVIYNMSNQPIWDRMNALRISTN